MPLNRGPSRLRRRIAIALTLVVALFVIVQSYLAYTSLAQQEDDLVDQVIQTEARRLVGQLAAGEDVLPADGTTVELTSRFTAWLFPDTASMASASQLPSGVAAMADGASVRSVDGRELHYLLTSTPVGRLIIEYDASADEAFVYRFGVYLAAIGLVVCAIAALVSVGIARLLVEPFSRMATHLSEWAPGAPAKLVGQSDEETQLLEAFDAAHRRLDESHAREREFAANVRHEVRTPLTALRTDIEMLALTQVLDDAGRQRLARMKATIDAIATDIESLHNLSRARPAEPEPVELPGCVDAVWAGLQHRNVGGALELVNALPRGIVATVDRLALMTILRNLLRNAIDHASPGRCTVEPIDNGLRISDSGPGIAAEDLPRIFDRHFSRHSADTRSAPVSGLPAAPSSGSAVATTASADERGLGLAIAKQTASARGWSLTVTSQLGVGTAFELVF